VIHAHERLVTGPWQGLNVGLLHGALPTTQKQAVVTAFAAGKLHAVVATTVVEVGIDVPNATIMIVEHADRYGLSQLHQLRGRVGRGSLDSLCVLIAHDRDGKAAERLAVMTETTDGFKIAEADLRQRGPGQLFGTKQHGLPELRVASILDDFGLLEQARQDAFALAAADPTLARPEHEPLLPALKRMFGEKLALIDAA
jgi:ATP-dependent DNA helicase RecG